MYDVGTKLVCVDDKFPEGTNDVYNALPKKGSIYTVRDVVAGQTWKLKPDCALYLEELINKPNRHGIEPGFLARRFVEPEELEQFEEVKEAEPIKVKAPKKRELVPL